MMGMTEAHNIIMKYDTPLGVYVVDESFDIWLNGAVIDTAGKSILDVRKRIATDLDTRRATAIREMQNKISEYNGMSHRIEDYRVKF